MTAYTSRGDVGLAGPGWGLWILWMLASTVAWAVGAPVGVAAGAGNIIVAGYVGIAVGGVVVGALQWLLLRHWIHRAIWWVAANIAAVAVVGILVFGLGLINVDVGWVIGVAVFGTVVGVLQWLVLRHEVGRAGWWVLASTVGWVVGGPLGGFVGWAALGAAYGAITGAALVWLGRQPR